MSRNRPAHYSSTDDDDDDDEEAANGGDYDLDAITRLLMSIRHPDAHRLRSAQVDIERQPPPRAQSSSQAAGVHQRGRIAAAITVAPSSSLPPTTVDGEANIIVVTTAATMADASTTATDSAEPATESSPTFGLDADAATTTSAVASQPSLSPAAAVAVAAALDDSRYCWVCFATDDEDDELSEWVQPCNCIGTIRWVHQGCLQRWVDEKQKGNSLRRVTCPQCQTEYIIVYPAMSLPVQVWERFDTMLKCLSPFLAAGLLVGSLYWTAVTFGAVTVLQVVGQQEGLDMMENADPLVLLIGLPAIPVGLVLGRMVRWEDMMLRLMHSRRGLARKFPLLGLLMSMPDDAMNSSAQPPATGQTPPAPIVSDQVSGTRIFCGALLLPTFSVIVGRLLFDSVQNNVHRTLLGGLTFVAIKGAIKIYFRQKQLQRKKQRRILDYTVENQERYVSITVAGAGGYRGGHAREVVI